MEILSVKNLTVTYMTVPVVNGVSFTVNNGDYFCIVGSNGSGKSSLIKGILGLVPVSGEVRYGVPRNRVAYLPQINSIPLDMPATVKEIVMTGMQDSKRLIYSNEDKRKAAGAMELLRITSLAKERIGELSGGQKQRVLLARALCKKPELLILDEPCSGLDEDITGNLYSVLTEMNKKEGMTIVMVSHDIYEVGQRAGRIAVLDKTVKFLGSTDEWKKYRSEKNDC